MTSRRLATVAAALLALTLSVAACSGGSSDDAGTTATQAPAQSDVLTDLTSVEQLRTRFNADRGVPRLLLLLSPT